MESFKLMKLPCLAMEHVIKSMSLMEAFNLALCSPALRYFVKHFFKKQKVKLLVEITTYILFRLKSSSGHSVVFDVCELPEPLEVLEECKTMKIGNTSGIPFGYDEPETNILVTYWKDIVKGAIELYTQMLDLFNIHFEKLFVMKVENNVDYGSAVGWINRINIPIEDAYFAKGTVDDDLYSQIINSENFRKCVTYQKPSEDFNSPEFRFTDAHVNWQVYNAHWLTPENLSEIGSVCLILYDVKFTDQEMNTIFKDLITGKFKSLEMIAIGLNRRDFDPYAMMDGIDMGEANWDIRSFDRYGYKVIVEGTHDVQMNTGRTCSFRFYTTDDVEGAHSGVNVFIWK